ncbi:hypothetical protein C8A00DRAFT_38356 [Chaetomidium leptoderma]|uniref:Uncharacterized protein n=1 Tax=Chaetomidium leptoderma TaxID=669021 RepID=A0AAN6VCR3_9PEZI|nr:hypothetical protein C8A00DRAFT_38356 [Chaetomidium leptoderma]
MSSSIAIPTRRTTTAASDFDTSAPYFAVPWDQSSTSTQSIPCPGRLSTHTDSGYATGNNTTFTSLSDKAKSKLSPQDGEESANRTARSVPLPGREELHIFRNDLDGAQIFRNDLDGVLRARFREIAPEMQRQLAQNAQKGLALFARSRRQMVMSLRLMMVGTTIETARPSIVIFLSGEGAGRLEALLEQPSLRSLYQPDDRMTPSFAVVVVGQAPRKRLCQDVQVVWDTSLSGERNLATYCGVQICLKTSEATLAMATLGGVVKLVYGPSDFKLVGMTAGHVLEELLDGGGIAEDDRAPYDAAREDSTPSFSYPRNLGKILHPPVHDGVLPDHSESLTPICDWALFELDPTAKIRPNLLHQIGASANPFERAAHISGMANNGRTLITAPPASFPSVEPIQVVLLGGSSHFGGTMLGLLSHVPGGIMLNPDHGFVDAYLLTLDEGQELCDGDSGSWVVSPVSMEVYGHVVATDMTGDAYVIPLHQSFAEMKELLGVKSVDLPRTADLLDAALRASTAGVVGPGQAMLVEDCSRERRASEVFLMCDGWKLRDQKRSSLYHDGDSGYGSMRSTLGSSPY